MMKLSRSKFKYALRKCKRDKETIIADNIAEQLCQRDSHDFGAKNRVRFGSSHPGAKFFSPKSSDRVII